MKEFTEYILIDRTCGVIDRGQLSTVIRTLNYLLTEEFRRGSDFQIREFLVTEIKILSTEEIANALEEAREDEKMRNTM